MLYITSPGPCIYFFYLVSLFVALIVAGYNRMCFFKKMFVEMKWKVVNAQ